MPWADGSALTDSFTSATVGATYTAVYNAVQGTLPSPWQSTDVGAPRLPGTADYSASTGTVYIDVTGTDIHGRQRGPFVPVDEELRLGDAVGEHGCLHGDIRSAVVGMRERSRQRTLEGFLVAELAGGCGLSATEYIRVDPDDVVDAQVDKLVWFVPLHGGALSCQRWRAERRQRPGRAPRGC